MQLNSTQLNSTAQQTTRGLCTAAWRHNVNDVIPLSPTVTTIELSWVELRRLWNGHYACCSGAHCIQVTAGDVEVTGSPFVCEVFDVNHVYVSMPRRAAVTGHLYQLQGGRLA